MELHRLISMLARKFRTLHASNTTCGQTDSMHYTPLRQHQVTHFICTLQGREVADCTSETMNQCLVSFLVAVAAGLGAARLAGAAQSGDLLLFSSTGKLLVRHMANLCCLLQLRTAAHCEKHAESALLPAAVGEDAIWRRWRHDNIDTREWQTGAGVAM